MTPQEFKKRMQTLQEVILRALTNYEVMKKLRYNDENDEDWTLDQQNNLLGRFKGFFSPVSLALTDMTFIQFAKIFDPNKRTASFRILLDAALEDASLLSHISADEFAEVLQDVEDSKALVAKLKRLRDQQLAHADANPLPAEPITLGDLDKLAESIKTNFNRLSSGHDKSHWLGLRVENERAGHHGCSESSHGIRGAEDARTRGNNGANRTRSPTSHRSYVRTYPRQGDR